MDSSIVCNIKRALNRNYSDGLLQSVAEDIYALVYNEAASNIREEEYQKAVQRVRSIVNYALQDRL